MKAIRPNPHRPAPDRPNRRALLPLLLAAGAVAGLAGCVGEPDSHVLSAPPPSSPPPATSSTVTTSTSTPVVVTHPDGSQTTQTVTVTEAPPAPQSEVVSTRPGPDYVWLAAYWRWRDSRYEWVAGHWEIPPRPDAVWTPPRWTPEDGGYRFYEGHWD